MIMAKSKSTVKKRRKYAQTPEAKERQRQLFKTAALVSRLTASDSNQSRDYPGHEDRIAAHTERVQKNRHRWDEAISSYSLVSKESIQ